MKHPPNTQTLQGRAPSDLFKDLPLMSTAFVPRNVPFASEHAVVSFSLEVSAGQCILFRV